MQSMESSGSLVLEGSVCLKKQHHDAFAAIGSRVKFLVDTPEALWGQLDSGQPLVAARRFRAAELVHEALTTACPEALQRQFPLLRNNWAAIESKRPDILDAANASLREASALPQVLLLS